MGLATLLFRCLTCIGVSTDTRLAWVLLLFHAALGCVSLGVFVGGVTLDGMSFTTAVVNTAISAFQLLVLLLTVVSGYKPFPIPPLQIAILAELAVAWILSASIVAVAYISELETVMGGYLAALALVSCLVSALKAYSSYTAWQLLKTGGSEPI